MTSELIKSLSVSNVLQTREAVLEKLAAARRLIAEAQTQFESFREQMGDQLHGELAFADPEHLIDSSRTHRGYSQLWTTDSGWSSLVDDMDARLWSFLMAKSGMMDFLDAQAKADWHKNIEDNNVPPLTRETIAATFESLHDNKRDLFERGVCNVFCKLSGAYRTNNPVLFGPKLILTYFRDGLGFNYDRTRQLDDLVRAFHVLDGKPVPTMGEGVLQGLRAAAGQGAYEAARGEADLPYFTVKWFKKGTAHLVFKRPDLVEQLNEIVARHHPDALPASR